jgi:hypothetical protein
LTSTVIWAVCAGRYSEQAKRIRIANLVFIRSTRT